MKMDAWPAEVKFQKPWRTYQERVLSQLQKHLDDDHLHVIAAPGSGKTVLGLEVARRLNKATLVFCPTLAIRDQWVDRLAGLFFEGSVGIPSWVSTDIKKPGFFTVSTYQGLHSAYTGQVEQEPDDEGEQENDSQEEDDTDLTGGKVSGRGEVIRKLRDAGVGTLVLDEAHHLRNEWWKCLIDVKNKLDGLVTVSLTATPPYDVTPLEWERYSGLCGAVDSEICVPELVLERNLCPHQDYVYFSTPLRTEREQIKEFRRQVGEFVKGICGDEGFIKALEGHPCVRLPREHVEEILSDPGFYSSIAFFLNHVRGRAPKRLLRIIGYPARKCPKLKLEWMEELLAGCLYSHIKEFGDSKELFCRISGDLKRIGAIDRRQVGLRSTSRIAKLLVSSASKLQSISDIVRIESESLGGDLRMVILTDYIRREDLPRNSEDIKPIMRIGVVPIFEEIRWSQTSGIKLGILSGSLVVIPRESRELLEEIAGAMGIGPGSIRYSALPHDDGFFVVEIGGPGRREMVRLMTRVFRRGGVTVLVGTKSLLGEGWDAPSVNSLVLASFVGSYMLSNQIRGRAIRTQEGNPEKTANVWHLVCVETGRADASEDMEMLTRRFKAFEGVSPREAVIVSGIERLELGKAPFSAADVEQINAGMKKNAQDRERLRAEWEQALASGKGWMQEEVTSSFFTLPRSFVFTNTILAVLWQGINWGLFVFCMLMRASEDATRKGGTRGVLLIVGIAFLLSAVAALPKFLKALYLFVKHAPVTWSMKQIGKALVRSLAHAELVGTNVSKLKVVTTSHGYGTVSCSLKGGETYEKYLFLDTMQEILGPINNPRYIMVRKTPLLKWLRKDYHVVPQVLGRNKELAEYFSRMWAKYVGPTELIYTRNVKGRRALLGARGEAMSASFQRRAERTRSWK